MRTRLATPRFAAADSIFVRNGPSPANTRKASGTSAFAKASRRSKGRFQGCNLAQKRATVLCSGMPHFARTERRSTLAASRIHQSLSTTNGVNTRRSAGIPIARNISHPAVDPAAIISFNRKKIGATSGLIKLFHGLVSNGRMLEASVQKIRGVPLSFADASSIQYVTEL